MKDARNGPSDPPDTAAQPAPLPTASGPPTPSAADSGRRPPHSGRRQRGLERYYVYAYTRGSGMMEDYTKSRDDAIAKLAMAKVTGGRPQRLLPPGDTWDEDPDWEADVERWIERYNAWQCPHPTPVVTLSPVEIGGIKSPWIHGRLLCLDCRSYIADMKAPLKVSWYEEPRPAPEEAKRTGA